MLYSFRYPWDRAGHKGETAVNPVYRFPYHCIPFAYHSCETKEIHLWNKRNPTVIWKEDSSDMQYLQFAFYFK